jgi:DNA-binding beta-propeller fold protein YncE
VRSAIHPKIGALAAIIAWSAVGPGVPPVPPVQAQQTGTSRPPEADYWMYVAAESEDEVALIRFGPEGARVEQTIPVGSFPTDIDGPHGIAVHPDGSRWYVSIAHGLPYGEVVAYSTETNERVGRVKAGLFPATMAIDPVGLLFVANFNLHGDHVPSSISVIETGSMLELTQIETCTMPHGARFSPDGTMLYSVCMMDDQLVEIDARTLSVRRRFGLTPGREALLAGQSTRAPEMSSMRAAEREGHVDARCGPTWVEAAPDGEVVYVACNKNAEVLELDLGNGSVRRRFPAGKGPYNLAVSPDGRSLVVTFKGDQAVGVFDLETGESKVVSTTRRLPHGVVISPDSRYAFVSVEGVGGEPGTVDVIDVSSGEGVARVDLGKQAGGIGFWKITP